MRYRDTGQCDTVSMVRICVKHTVQHNSPSGDWYGCRYGRVVVFYDICYCLLHTLNDISFTSIDNCVHWNAWPTTVHFAFSNLFEFMRCSFRARKTERVVHIWKRIIQHRQSLIERCVRQSNIWFRCCFSENLFVNVLSKCS